MFSLERAIGILCGIIVGLIICFIVVRKMNSDNKFKTEYDERQRAIRDRGFFYGFWVFLGTCAVVALLETSGLELPFDPFVKFFAEFFVSAVVICVYTILKGAYFGLNSIRSRFYIFMIFVSVVNIAVFVMGASAHGFIVDGMVITQFTNLLCGLLFLVIAVAMIVKNIQDKKAAEEDDDDEES